MFGRPIFIVSLCFCILPVVTVFGGEDEESPASIAQLNSRIEQLQRRLEEMEKEHKAEINELREQINQLSSHGVESRKDDELSSLQELAKSRAEEGAVGEEKSEEVTFKSGGLGLQALNPEISVTGDFLFSVRDDKTSDQDSDFNFRNLGVHIESWLDPYTRFKSAIEFNEDEAELGEAYVILHDVTDDLNVTLGKFRQQFGVVNRWHKHGLDQVDFPLALRQIFGEGGLNQSGASFDWMMEPIGETSQQLTFQVTDGSNDRLFGGNARNRPSFLGRYKNFRYLSKDTYVEWGASGLLGWNEKWDISDGSTRNSCKATSVLGVDFSVLWKPTEKMRYRNVEWRSEAYLLNRDISAPDGSASDTLRVWGLYSYLQSKITRTIDIGIRGDFFVPDSKGYAGISGYSLSPLAVTEKNPYLWQVGPYLTWWQSPFVKFRVEYNHSEGDGISYPEDVLWFQCIFGTEPHKHERH